MTHTRHAGQPPVGRSLDNRYAHKDSSHDLAMDSATQSILQIDTDATVR